MDSTDLPVTPQPEQPKPSESEPFGPWMVVERKQRRGPRKHMDAKVTPPKPTVVASRFSSLSEVVALDIPAQAGVFTRSHDSHAISKDKMVISIVGKPSKLKSATVVRKPLSVQGPSRLRFHSTATSLMSRPASTRKALDRVNHLVVSMSENTDPNFLVPPIFRGQTTCDAIPPDKRDSGGTSVHPLPACDVINPSEQSKGEAPSDRATMVVDLEVESNMDSVA
ncbi:hypothetical protein V6N11_068254 [Hibiscus sabdariffa]|uniref:Uncharacterized protein n=1 Tax=Hibiscus sabdariffa TaxID=183260 RepID=A0ABR1ZW25_9ROSI